MTEYQRLFLVQARTDLDVFQLLCQTENLPECHALHYLQMGLEILAKAYFWAHSPRTDTHVALVPLLKSLITNRCAQREFGFRDRNAQWNGYIHSALVYAARIKRLAPKLAGEGPNAEYPWPKAAPKHAPVEHDFGILQELLEKSAGRKFLDLMQKLARLAEDLL